MRNGAHAIDIEIETAEVAQDRLSQFRGRTYVIVSYHNFEATPPMDTVVNRVMKVQADAYKIVTTARKPTDNVRVLAAAKALPKHRMIVLAMGELGFPTRVLSPVFGGVYTYAAPMYAEGTAAGQVSSRYLRHLYRVEKLGKIRQDLRRDRRAGPPLHFARRPQPGLSVATRGCGLPALPGLPGMPARLLLAWPPSCRSPVSASPFRTSRKSSATWTWWTRWRGASAPSTPSGARPASGAAPIPTPPASPDRSPACSRLQTHRC